MAIKNNPVSDRGELALSYPVAPLEVNPKKQLQERAGDENGQRLFQLFLRKLPQAQQLAQQLIPDHLNTTHLPFCLSFLFMTYMEHQIELYQSQVDPDVRDLSLDEKWSELRLQFAVQRSKLFVKTDSPFTSFVADLAAKLKEVDCAADFEKTVGVFLQLLRIDHVGSIHLAAIFLNKDPSRAKKGEKVLVHMPRAALERAFKLLVQQLLSHHRWYLVQSKEVAMSNMSKRQTLDGESSTIDLAYRAKQNVDCEKAEKQLGKELQLLLSLDLNDNAALNKTLQRVKKRVINVQSILSRLARPAALLSLTDLDIQDPASRIVIEKALRARLNDSGLSEAERNKAVEAKMATLDYETQDINRYVSLHDCYLIEPFSHLVEMMEALIDSNCNFEESQARGTKPLLAQGLPPILPAPQQLQGLAHDEKVYQELMNEETTRKKTAGGKKGSSHKGAKQAKKSAPAKGAHPSSQHKPVSTQKENAASSKVVAGSAKQTAPGVVSSIDQLRLTLLGLYEVHPTFKSLRQAIWHLDALKSVQEAYGKTHMLPKDHLNYINAIAQGAQKVLEQTYRFRIGEQESTAKVHNLKQLHTLLDPSSPPPDIVNTLYLANHWGRYFHLYYNQLTSETTYTAEMPPLLDLLVSAARNSQSLTGPSSQKWAEEMIEKTCAQTELLLKPFLGAANPSPTAPELPPQLPCAIQTGKFQGVCNALKAFLVAKRLPSDHPSALRLEQALSALAMLTASLEKLNGSPHQRALATWTSWSLFQLQEVVENVLHAIEFFKDTEITLSHELKKLAEKIELDMGSLSADLHSLSYKPRYPAEYLVEGKGAELIDDAEALNRHPELQEGFQLPGLPKLLWKLPTKEVSNASILNRLNNLLDDTEAFLRGKALPALQSSWEAHHAQ